MNSIWRKNTPRVVSWLEQGITYWQSCQFYSPTVSANLINIQNQSVIISYKSLISVKTNLLSWVDVHSICLFCTDCEFWVETIFFVLRCVILCSAHTLPCNVAETATGNNVRFKDHILLQLRQSAEQCVMHASRVGTVSFWTWDNGTIDTTSILIQFVGGAVQVGVRFVIFWFRRYEKILLERCRMSWFFS